MTYLYILNIQLRMKKILLIVAMMATMTLGAQAQNKYQTKHEIALSYGTLANSFWLDVFEEVLSAPFTGSISRKNETYYGPIGAEYFYRLNKTVQVGGIATLGHYGYDIYADNTDKGEVSNYYFTLMPAVKFSWLTTKNVGLYSKAGIGATYRTEKNEKINYDENAFHVNWHVSLLGFEAGSPSLRGFTELGVGEQGLFMLGIRYKFN